MAKVVNGVLVIEWTVDDIQERCKWLTFGEAEEILFILADSHDANEGVNWEIIDTAVEPMYPRPDNWVDPDMRSMGIN